MTTKSTVERRAYILKQIETQGRVDVASLSHLFGVSEVTVRKDLSHFEKKNLLVRSRGGAFKQSLIDIDSPINDRRKQNLSAKQQIGKLAASLIVKGETILLDSGTTIMEMAKNISKQNETTVITNAIDIAYQLSENPKTRVIVPGGILRRNSLSLVGEQAANTLRDFYCDKCFIGADGIDMEKGLLTANIEEAHLMRINIRNAKQVIALVDSSKFQAKGIMAIAALDEVHTIITDKNIPSDIKNKLEAMDIQIIIAG